MQKRIGITLFFLCIVMLMVAGCTSETLKTEVVSAPTIVATGAETKAPVVEEIAVLEPAEFKDMATVAPAIVQKGKVIVSAPHKSSVGEVKTVELFVDGQAMGTVVSNEPRTIELNLGSHEVKISRDSGEELKQTTIVLFGKSVNVAFEPSEPDNAYQTSGTTPGVYEGKVGNIRLIVNAHNVDGTCVVAGTVTVKNEGTKLTETHVIGYSVGGYSGTQQFTITLRPGESQTVPVVGMVDEAGLHRTGAHRIVGLVRASVIS